MADTPSDLEALQAAQRAVTRTEAEIRVLCEVLSAVYDVAEAAITAIDDPGVVLQHLRSLIHATAQLERHWYTPLAARLRLKT
jgi:hypothetical protein